MLNYDQCDPLEVLDFPTGTFYPLGCMFYLKSDQFQVNYISGWWFYFFEIHPYLEKWSNLTNIFQRGWNHPPDNQPINQTFSQSIYLSVNQWINQSINQAIRLSDRQNNAAMFHSSRNSIKHADAILRHMSQMCFSYLFKFRIHWKGCRCFIPQTFDLNMFQTPAD